MSNVSISLKRPRKSGSLWLKSEWRMTHRGKKSYFWKKSYQRETHTSIIMDNNSIDWGKLGFGYMKSDYNVRCYYRDGKWGEIEVSSDENRMIVRPSML